jgi:hypothetical protein
MMIRPGMKSTSGYSRPWVGEPTIGSEELNRQDAKFAEEEEKRRRKKE